MSLKKMNKLKIEGNVLYLLKGIYEKSTADITLNGERLKALPIRSKITQGC
jgi:hypothetical protein